MQIFSLASVTMEESVTFFHLKDYTDLVDSRYVAQYSAITMMTLLTS